jgi:hypothetical protein
MGAAVKLAVGGSQHLYTALFALGCLIGTVFIPYHRYVDVLKWLTFSLFAYVGIVFTVHLDWHEVAKGAFLPRFELSGWPRARPTCSKPRTKSPATRSSACTAPRPSTYSCGARTSRPTCASCSPTS